MVFSSRNISAFSGNVMYMVGGMFNSRMIYSAEVVVVGPGTDWWGPFLHRHGMHMGYKAP